VVDQGVAPPLPVDDLEDWVRWPPDPDDITARATNLRRRVVLIPEPAVLDDDGLLRRGEHWVAFTEVQVPVLRLLLDNLDRVVRFQTILETYAEAGGTSNEVSVRTVLSRLDARLRPLGLELETVRRRGVLLRNVRA